MEDGSQPLCYSTNLREDMKDRCWVCRGDYDQFYLGGDPGECYCEPGVDRYEIAILCKVFTTTTPAHNLDITTPLRYEIYDMSGKQMREVDDKFDDLIHDHYHQTPATHTIVLDGSLVEEDYQGILRNVSSFFRPMVWDFKGSHAKDRYIEFAEQRLKQTLEMPLLGSDLKPENNHLGQRKKGTSHAHQPQKGKKKGKVKK